MTARPVYVTAEDLALLSAIARTGSVAAASRALHIPRDRGVYRLSRLADATEGPVIRTSRGGATRGGTRLTARGWRLLRSLPTSMPLGGPAARGTTPARPSRLRGRWRRRPFPCVELAPGLALSVGFEAADGEPVEVAVDPEAVLLARRRFATSARNVMAATVRRLRAAPGGLVRVECRVGPVKISSLVTERAVRSLRLVRGSAVLLYVKATSIRRV